MVGDQALSPYYNGYLKSASSLFYFIQHAGSNL